MPFTYDVFVPIGVRTQTGRPAAATTDSLTEKQRPLSIAALHLVTIAQNTIRREEVKVQCRDSVVLQ